MIVPGPELLHQLNNCDDDSYIQFRKLDEFRDEDVAIGQKHKSAQEAINPGFLSLCCCISIGINLLLGLFCIICRVNLRKNIVCNYSYVTPTSLFWLAVVFGFAAWFVSSDVVKNYTSSKQKEHSGTIIKNKETVQRLRNEIIAALGSIPAPFPLLGYSMMMTREDHEMDSIISIESCWRLVHAVVPLVAQIDSSLQFLHVATGIQLGIGPTSLSVSRVEELRTTNHRLKHSATARLKQNLFRIMIQTMQSLDDMQTLLQQTTDRHHPPETTIIHEKAAVPNLLELYPYTTKEELPSFVLTLSLLKSCKVQVVSSLSRCAALLLESNAITCSQSALLNKRVQLSIQIANDGTEYLKQALFPFNNNNNDNNRIVDNNKDIICRLLVKLDAARTSLWCIQENASLEIEASTDEENSMYRTLVNDDVAWWTQCCKFLEESLLLGLSLLEKSLSAAQPDIQMVTHDVKDTAVRRPNENVDIAAKPKTEFVDTGGIIQQLEVNASSLVEEHRSSSVVKNECTTVIYSGEGKCCSNNPISVGSPRRRSAGSLDAVSFHPDVFMDELQTRLGTMQFPEELPLLRDNIVEGDDTPSVLRETNNYNAGPLEVEDKSSLLLELVELQKLMVQNYDLLS